MLAASIGTAYLVLKSPAIKEARMGADANILLASSAFKDNGAIPEKYTCKGENISPPLEISDVPEGTGSFAIIMHDPDAPSGDFTHWTIWNIDPSVTKFEENIVPATATEGQTEFGKMGYGGPCPPSGTHHYIFDLYALKTKLNLPAGSSRAQLETSMQGQIVAQTKLVGLVSAN